MTEDNITVFVFGDQTEDAREALTALLLADNGPVVQSFLLRSYQKILRELQDRFGSACGVCEDISSLLGLARLKVEGQARVSLDHALTTICHLALFLKWCEQNQGYYPKATETCLVGLCTGGLAAAAVSRCHSILELLNIAVDISLLSFRVGFLVAYSGSRFQPTDSTSTDKSWSIYIPELTLEEAQNLVEQFSNSQNLPLYSRPYIGVIASQGITFCGPPKILSFFKSYLQLRKFRCASLPIYAPYHASHIYDRAVVKDLMSQYSDPVSHAPGFQPLPLVLSDGKRPDAKPDRASVLTDALNAILIEKFDWHNVGQSLQIALSGSQARYISVVSISGIVAATRVQQIVQSITRFQIATPKQTPTVISNHSSENFENESLENSEIAIVGMSGRFPSAKDTEKLWQLLYEGRDVHKVVPETRWNAATHVDTSEKPRKNTSATKYGCWIDEAGLFDAPFFGISPREAEQTDPAQRLALMTTYEALEDGGIVPGSHSTQPSRVGVVYGVTSNDWMETNSAQNIDAYMIPGGNRAFIPGRINYFFKFSGPSYAVDTACSSSLAATDLACGMLWRNEADTVIVGGTNILTNPDFTTGLDRGRFLSRTGGCKTFDDTADGYCRGEGVVTVILKRLNDAIRDNDPVRGVIVNISTNHSAETESITRPNLKAQENLFTRVMGDVSPSRVTYIEMHGTGTQVGDLTEMSSVLKSIAPISDTHKRNLREKLYLGSLKSNIGHGEAAAGVSSLVKLLLMMQNNTIPPHCGIKTRINHRFPNLEERNTYIARKPIPWKAVDGRRRYALVNNFSAAGGNTALLLRDYTTRKRSGDSDPRTFFPFVVSAKCSASLRLNVQNLLTFLSKRPDICIPSLSYTTTARRITHQYRFPFTASNHSEVLSKLASFLEASSNNRAPTSPSIVFAFSGQGSQYFGMGKQLYECFGTFKRDIDTFDAIAQGHGFNSFVGLIKNTTGDITASPLDSIHLAIVCLQIALTRLLLSWNISPLAVVGHSLGHYSALNASGVISDTDTIFIVGTRACQLQKKCKPWTHSMLVVRASCAVVNRYLAGTSVEIVCINSDTETVIGGNSLHVNEVRSALTSNHIVNKLLHVPYAFHSCQVDCCLQDFQESISGISFSHPNLPVLCPVYGEIMRTDAPKPTYFSDHYRQKVNFMGAIQSAEKAGLVNDRTVFLEIGHDAVVSSMLRRILNCDTPVIPMISRRSDPWRSISDMLTKLCEAGSTIAWSQFHRDFIKSMSVLRTPMYHWNLKEYWIKYTNDWSLHKGERLEARSSELGIITTTIHKIGRETIAGIATTLSLYTDLTRSDLDCIVSGHLVEGFPLCSPSIYADIAMTAGKYLQKRLGLWPDIGYPAIEHLTIHKALIAQKDGVQWLKTNITVRQDRKIDCRFQSVDDNDEVTLHHADCEVVFHTHLEKETLLNKTNDTSALIESLRQDSSIGRCYKFSKNMIYRMVATLATFGEEYKGLQEIVLDNDRMAAASKIFFKSEDVTRSTSYSINPGWIDSLSQSAGFIMNAHESSELATECFVNHGWKSLQIFKNLNTDTLYESFIKMTHKENTTWEGTMTVLCGKDTVAIFEGIQLQGIPRRLLSHVLISTNKSYTKSRREINETKRFATRSNPEIDDNRISSIENSTVFKLLDKLMDILSSETGIKREDLDDDTDFVNIGIDSLMSLIITDRLTDDLGFETPSKHSIFNEFKNIGELKAAVISAKGLNHQVSSDYSITIQSDQTRSAIPGAAEAGASGWYGSSGPSLATPSSHGDTYTYSSRIETAKPASSVVFQKTQAISQNTATMNLFLFPDGSGSAGSYASLPRPLPNVSLIGLICPYRKEPHAMNCSLNALLSSYLAEIRRRQPNGPYHLAGWSSGGIFAFLVAQILLEDNIPVANLILIDSPPPNNGLERLPERFYKHCHDIGIFKKIGKDIDNGCRPSIVNSHSQLFQEPSTIKANSSSVTRSPPDWLIPHFRATVDLLSEYCPSRLRLSQGGDGKLSTEFTVSILWASECALDGVQYDKYEVGPEDGDGVRFLTERRQDFGSGGWEILIPEEAIKNIETIQGSNHFNMMYGKGAEYLSRCLAKILSCH